MGKTMASGAQKKITRIKIIREILDLLSMYQVAQMDTTNVHKQVLSSVPFLFQSTICFLTHMKQYKTNKRLFAQPMQQLIASATQVVCKG